MGKYFGTDGFRGEANISLTADHAYKIGRFLGWYYGMLRQQQKNSKLIKIRINIKRDALSYIILILQAIMLLRLPSGIVLYLGQLFSFCLIGCLMFNDIKLFYSFIITRMKNRRCNVSDGTNP